MKCCLAWILDHSVPAVRQALSGPHGLRLVARSQLRPGPDPAVGSDP